MTPRRVYVLGAGASYGSDAPTMRIPLQPGFFAHAFNSHLNPVRQIPDVDLCRQPLRSWLCSCGLATIDDPAGRLRTDPSINVEDLYAHLEEDETLSAEAKDTALSQLDYVVFQIVSWPVVGLRNEESRQCPEHMYLARSARPGDTFISFNYDTLLDDALLYGCDFWHPLTGQGIDFRKTVGGTIPKKAEVFNSRVLLLKPHGSATYRYRRKHEKTTYALVGLVAGIQPLTMRVAEGWEPLIVAPSRRKAGHRKHMSRILDQATARMRNAEELVVIGFSFPAHDEHLKGLFAAFNGHSVIVVNPDRSSAAFNDRLQQFGLTATSGYDTLKDLVSEKALGHT